MASWLKVKAGRCPPRCSPKKGLLKSAPSTMKLLKMPRWPLMFSSSPSGPWEIDAPGVSRARFRKLRPSLGSASTTSSWMRCERVTSVASITARRLADDGHRLGHDDPQLDIQVEHPADPQNRTFDALGSEPGGRRRHRQVVDAGRQQGAHESPGRRRLHRRQQIGLLVPDDDHRPRHGIARRVPNGAADDAGGRARLSRELRYVDADERKKQDRSGRNTRRCAAMRCIGKACGTVGVMVRLDNVEATAGAGFGHCTSTGSPATVKCTYSGLHVAVSRHE